VLAADPQNPDAYHLFGLLAHAVDNHDVAATLIEKAIELNPEPAGYHFNLGVVRQASERLDDAVAAYREALRRNPKYRAAHENMGVALYDLGELEAAEKALERSVALGDVSALARHNLAAIVRDRGDLQGARPHLERALALHPAYKEARQKLAHNQFADGEFEAAWESMEWRGCAGGISGTRFHTRPIPVLPRRPENGDRLLITAEQGVGDEILFASCFGDVIDVAERCVIECDPRLVELFGRSFPDAQFIAGTASTATVQASGPYDWRVPAGSLPRYYRASVSDFPSRDAFLVADQSMRREWRARLDALPHRLNVGISWRGGFEARSRRARGIALKDLRWLLDSDVNVIDLQYGDHSDEIKRHGKGLVRFDDIDPLQALDNVAALTAELDLVISVDNTAVHVAGALGTPAWVMVPTTGEWRWIDKTREDTLWYSSLTLFRQKRTYDWSDVTSRIRERFDRWCANPSPRTPGLEATGAGSPAPSAETEADVLLLNDTTHWYHWGCSCTSIALHTELTKRYGAVDGIAIQGTAKLESIARSADELDAPELLNSLTASHSLLVKALESHERIVINGEGTLHGNSPAALGLLTLAYLAKTAFNKHVEIINHSCYPPAELEGLYAKVYSNIDRACVREPVSAARMRELGVDVIDSFDCLPLFADQLFGADRPDCGETVAIAGSVALTPMFLNAVAQVVRTLSEAGRQVDLLLGAASDHAADDFQFVQALQQQAPDCFNVVYTHSETDWLTAIGKASLLISGRFHHSIAAAWMGTPLVVMPSNTAKIDGLMTRLGIDVRVAPDAPLLTERVYSLLEDPSPALIDDETRRRLLALARANFD